jgi:hypothetical protein
MPSPIWFGVGLAFLMAGLFIQALVFHVTHIDPMAIYKLFAVRDKLIRLVIEGKIDRGEPHFETLYRELNRVLHSSRSISGPEGWSRAKAQGKLFARYPDGGDRTARMSPDEIPQPLRAVAVELRDALQHLLRHHQGIYLQINSKRREAERIRQAHARELLERMPSGPIMTSACPSR